MAIGEEEKSSISIHLVEDETFNNSVLDKPTGVSLATNLKQGTGASVYIALMLKELSKTFKLAVFPLTGALALVGSIHSLANNFKNTQKNRNGSFLFNLGVTVLFCAAELAGLVLGLVTIPASLLILAPIIFTVMSGFNVLRSIGEFFYHAVSAIRLRLRDEAFSIEYQKHIEGVIKSGFGFFINSIVLLGTLSTMLAPYVSAIGIFFGAATFYIQAATAGILGFGFLATVKNFIKEQINKFKPQSEKIPLTSMEVHKGYDDPEKFTKLDNNLGDLQIKLQVLFKGDQEVVDEVKGSNLFMNKLLDEESSRLEHLGHGHVKNQALREIKTVINTKTPNKNEELKKVLKKYENEMQKLTTSYFKEVGGMQKILVLANQYCGLFNNSLNGNEEKGAGNNETIDFTIPELPRDDVQVLTDSGLGVGEEDTQLLKNYLESENQRQNYNPSPSFWNRDLPGKAPEADKIDHYSSLP